MLLSHGVCGLLVYMVYFDLTEEGTRTSIKISSGEIFKIRIIMILTAKHVHQ